MKISRRALLCSTLLAAASLLPLCAATAADAVKPSAEELKTLVKRDIVVGTGTEAAYGRPVEVHYTGWLYDESAPDLHGRKFDSSVDRGDPFTFPLGGGRVIKGWDQGVVGMKVGGKRTLIIPASLGYGSRGAGGGLIPPDAILVFDVELLKVK